MRVKVRLERIKEGVYRAHASVLPHPVTVRIKPDETGGYYVWSPDVRGCNTQGETLREAEQNAKEALETLLEFCLEKGLPLTRAQERAAKKRVRVRAN